MKKNKVLDTNLVTLEAAIDQLQQPSSRKFVESVDLAVNLSVDPKQSNQMVKGSLVLPAGSG